MKKNRVAARVVFALCVVAGLVALAGCSSAVPSAAPASSDSSYPVATTEEVQAALLDDSAVVLDARSQDAYSGWSTGENTLGGHIDGAKGFSASWLTCAYDDSGNNDGRTRDERLQIAMENKGIKDDTQVIVYDENGTDAKSVADYLTSQGVTNIKTFNLADWDQDRVSYPNYQLYVPPTVVNDLIAGKTVKEIGAVSDLKIVDFSWGTDDESGFTDGHVPGAVHVNSDDVDDENNGYILSPTDRLIDTAKAVGITTKSTVIVTGAGLFAAHYATVLKYLGVENVYVMSGGANGWTDAGFEPETGKTTVTPADDFGTDVPLNPTYIDTTDMVKDNLDNDEFQLVDTRTMPEHVGDTSGYSYVPEAGRIPGSVFGQLDGSEQGPTANSSSMIYYENIDGTMRDADEIASMWKDSGVDTSRHLSFYCGGGYRAAEVMWTARVMGLDDTSLYNDGWSGWVVAGLPASKG